MQPLLSLINAPIPADEPFGGWLPELYEIPGQVFWLGMPAVVPPVNGPAATLLTESELGFDPSACPAYWKLKPSITPCVVNEPTTPTLSFAGSHPVKNTPVINTATPAAANLTSLINCFSLESHVQHFAGRRVRALGRV
jgi:hypothetical protein